MGFAAPLTEDKAQMFVLRAGTSFIFQRNFCSGAAFRRGSASYICEKDDIKCYSISMEPQPLNFEGRTESTWCRLLRTLWFLEVRESGTNIGCQRGHDPEIAHQRYKSSSIFERRDLTGQIGTRLENY